MSEVKFKIQPRCKTPDGQALYLTVQGNQVVVQTDLGDNSLQMWKRISPPKGGESVFIMNCQTGTYLRAPDANVPVVLASGPDATDSYMLWNYGARAIQSAHCENWNLNVRGNSYPAGTEVIAWHGWEAHDNECWNWLPCSNVQLLSERYKIAPKCRASGGEWLYLAAGVIEVGNIEKSDGSVVVYTENTYSDYQIWRIGHIGLDSAAIFVNEKTGKCLHTVDADKPVNLIDVPWDVDDYSMWHYGGRAIQSARCENWNLNVRGDSYVDGNEVIAWHGWQAHDNECWELIQL